MPHRSSHILAPIAPLVLLACTASWNALVRYSDQPAPVDQNAEIGVYVAVLRGYVNPYLPTTVLAPPDSTVGPVAAVVTGKRLKVPGYWADTLRRAVEAALADSAMEHSASAPAVQEAAAQAGLRLVLSQEFGARPALDDNGRPNAARLWISRPGFNPDSTIATIRTEYWCGMLCAHGVTLVLARRPGYQWRIWQSWLHWVS